MVKNGQQWSKKEEENGKKKSQKRKESKTVKIIKKMVKTV